MCHALADADACLTVVVWSKPVSLISCNLPYISFVQSLTTDSIEIQTHLICRWLSYYQASNAKSMFTGLTFRVQFRPSQNMVVPLDPPCSVPLQDSSPLGAHTAKRHSENIMGHFWSPLCTVCYWCHVELGVKFDFCDRLKIDLPQLSLH